MSLFVIEFSREFKGGGWVELGISEASGKDASLTAVQAIADEDGFYSAHSVEVSRAIPPDFFQVSGGQIQAVDLA